MNEKKILLADAITAMVHPDTNLEDIHNTAYGVFYNANSEMSSMEAYDIPSGTRIDKVLVRAGLASSQTSARRLIDGKGVKIDGNIVETYNVQVISTCVVSVGKKKFVKIIIFN